MKYLILFSDFGKTAPGIVYKTLITHIQRQHEVTFLAIDGDTTLPGKSLPVIKPRFTHNRIEEFFFTVIGINPMDYIWLFFQKRIIDKKEIEEQDIILSFTSFHNYKSLILGEYLARRYSKKWVVYSVDAIPAPIGWVTNVIYYKNLKNYISTLLSHTDGFFSSNRQMLEYQMQSFDSNSKITGSVYTPISKTVSGLSMQQNSCPIFLYTGGLYGPRKKEAFLDGFRLLLNDYPTAKICFVGKYKSNYFNSYIDLIESGHIEIHNYTNDLSKYYNNATILIDINAYFDNDVFLSSKIVNYLSVRRPILSITGDNSPARNVFTKDPSIFHCKHSPNEIYQTILKILSSKFNDWKGREYYINEFAADTVVDNFLKQIDRLQNE